MRNYSANRFYQLSKILWPIRRDELSIFLPMSLMMFCILFNFSALRSIKDSLVVPGIGAEVISFLKFWVVLPCAVGFSILYAKLSNILTPEKIFYIVVSMFLSILLLFSFVIYPNESSFHPDADTISAYADLYPHFKWQIRIIGKWSYVIVYVVGELWSAIVITLMFWQLANSIITTSQAIRIYPYFAVIGNLGLVLSGFMMIFSTQDELPYFVSLFLGDNVKGGDSITTLQLSSISITFFGVLAMFLYRYVASYVMSKRRVQLSSNKKTKLSVRESFVMIIHSKYLWNILAIVVAYGLAINVVEGPWKNKIKELYPSTLEYIRFMGNFNIWMGVSCVIFTIFGSNILRFGSWLIGALVTPVVVGITGGLFFTFVVFANDFTDYERLILNPIFAAVILGAIQNIMSKSTKYSLFDATKEMAYIPLDHELKSKGKAAVDVIGTKLGKSMGALIQSMMFSFFPIASFELISPYLMIVFISIIFVWVFAVRNLNKEYSALL